MTTVNKEIEQLIAGISWCDAKLCSVSWLENGRDLLLKLLTPRQLPSGAQEEVQLLCRWVSKLEVKITFGSLEGGHPMTWDVLFQTAQNGGILIELDLASQGSISFECTELEML